MNNKKGLTLIEVVCALALLAITLIFGAQLFGVASKNTARGAQVDAATQKVTGVLETGVADPEVTVDVGAAATIKFTVYGEDVTLSPQVIRGTCYLSNTVASRLQVAGNSTPAVPS